MEYAVRSPTQAQLLISSIRRYTPALIVDPYANYVIQSCLTFGAPLNQFVFDVLATRSDDICHSKFGARAMRACLESKLTSEGQKVFARGWDNHAYWLSANQCQPPIIVETSRCGHGAERVDTRHEPKRRTIA